MNAFLQLTLALAVIILAAKAGGLISVRLHQPAVLGELLMGVLLGPTVVDLIHLPFFSDPHFLQEEILDLATLGVVFLMFTAGLEIELNEMRRAGRAALLSGTFGVIVPLIMGALVALPFGYHGEEAWFIGIILTATSVSISAQTLLELGVLRTREGITLLGAAVVDDVLVLVLLSVFLALAGGTAGAEVIVVVVKMFAYLLAAGLLGWFVLPRIVAWVDRQPISEGLIATVVFVTLVFAWSAEVIGGLAAITGAFIAGVGLGRSSLSRKDRNEDALHHLRLLSPSLLRQHRAGSQRARDHERGAAPARRAACHRIDLQAARRRAGRAAGGLHQSASAARGRRHDLARRGRLDRSLDRRARADHLAGDIFGGGSAGTADHARRAAAVAIGLSSHHD